MGIGFLLKHELAQFFKNWTLSISIFICFCVGGFFIWYAPYNIIEAGYASMNMPFVVFYWLLIIFIPAISMGKISEEKSSGLLNLMISKPIALKYIVIAKWLATFIITLIAILLTLPYCITISFLGNMDWGITACGYLGLILHSALIISISLYTSAKAKNSFNALFYTWIILFIIVGIPSSFLLLDLSSGMEMLIMRFALNEYFRSMNQGMLYVHGAVLYIVISIIFTILTGHALTESFRTRRTTIRHYSIIITLIAITITTYFSPVRVDLSLSNKFSLSPITIETLQKNEEPISVNIYYSDNLPAESTRYSRELFMLLRSYRSESHAPFTIKAIKVNSKEMATFAKMEGITPTISESHNTNNTEDIYFGATIQVGEEHRTVINPLSSTTPIEYELTRTIYQTSVESFPTIGLAYGHNETEPNLISQFINEVRKIANIRMVNLDREPSLNTFDVICIIGPQEQFTISELKKLQSYLEDGGRLFIALRHAIGRINDFQATSWFTIQRTGLEELLEYMGMKINYNFIIDNNCSALSIQQEIGHNITHRNIKFPYFPIITHFDEHIITNGLNSIMLPFASGIEQVKTTTTYIYESLAQTSSISGIKTPPIAYQVQTRWNRKDFDKGQIDIAALLKNENSGGAVVAISNAAFINDEVVKMFGNDNINFAINSVEWLADNTGLIQLRNKYNSSPVLSKMSASTIKGIKALSASIPLILIILITLVSYFKSRHQNILR